MHVITIITTTPRHLDVVLDELKTLHVTIEKITGKGSQVEILAEAYSENPDDLIYNKLHKINGVTKIFAKVLDKSKQMYA